MADDCSRSGGEVLDHIAHCRFVLAFAENARRDRVTRLQDVLEFSDGWRQLTRKHSQQVQTKVWFLCAWLRVEELTNDPDCIQAITAPPLARAGSVHLVILGDELSNT